MATRRYSLADRLIAHLDRAVRTTFGHPPTTGRPHPAGRMPDAGMAEHERRQSVRLMRVNHCGEVCAQALYQGQALTAREPHLREAMEQAAREENDHLDWCAGRIEELQGRTSLLNPVFYLSSLAIGTAAGLIGDRFSLGFLAETERQVVRHLEGHLLRLPREDDRSRSILEQMRVDEAAHATHAIAHGGVELPGPLRRAMGLSSRLMTGSTYWV